VISITLVRSEPFAYSPTDKIARRFILTGRQISIIALASAILLFMIGFEFFHLQYGESGSGAQFSFVIQRGFNGTVAPVATGTSDCFPSAAGSLPLCPALPRKEQVRYDGLGLNSAGRLQQPFRETCGAAPRQGRDAVVGAPRRFAPVPGTLDQPAILDSLFRPVTLPGMGIAISPRGDMLKNRVPVYPRTHRVGNQLNFR